ncbi:hypothetical protein COV49_00980 [Candidatus Falkowbacteria bacterium CG11_big_fil_rev_8_21_14_0_20_39_10]|uniref:Bacterial type II secretion system protein E domain-containing protein n=1 Tax=Candidatus Falkowbacteria bacterium CG11_big_fil_rev_8_21_14_0_20_39_10 TaxID=1974570 RepID=A0A2M6KA61_9BACT|nr:MAG: hypothetical protein COV49_00980 [Candidatus Falkowbacteria bacterium CG11_big_fil_rev_8_21_14_0_20_39_10]
MEVPSIFLNKILSDSAKKGASSLHLSVGSAPMARIKGKITLMEEEGIMQTDTINQIINSFLEKGELAELEKNRELTTVKVFGSSFRFRVNIFYQKGMPSLSFNYVTGVIRSLNDYKFPQQFKELINFDSGLLIVAGSNDSGKTSTAAALIEEVNKNKKRYIITLEKPIEYLFVNKKSIIEQRQVDKDALSYSLGIEHCLEEDVDLVYIDEVKKEFKDIILGVLELAAGNSLVILEMNADNSIWVIEKIINMASTKISAEAVRYSLADVLIGIVVQKLIPSVGGGLALAFETLVSNSATKSLIREGRIYQLESIIQTSRGEGMVSMKKSVDDLIRSGEVQAEEGKMLNL